MNYRNFLAPQRGERCASLVTGVRPTWSRFCSGAEEFLLRPRPLSLLLFGSFLSAVIFCLSVFDLGFVMGTSPYWQAPRGLVGNSWADIPSALSGYNYFVRDGWMLPLFQTSKLGVPNPVAVVFTDSIPIVAMCGRLLYRATGLIPNLYGAWTALCFVVSALSMTGLVAALGQRGIAPALLAAACALCMPALLDRWGHMSLMAQWELLLALIIYVRSRSTERPKILVALSLLLAAFTLWTHSYLFVMVVGVLAAALGQAVIDRRVRILPAASIIALYAIVLIGLVLITGHLSTEAPLAANGFGGFSMNLLSPIFPQFSGLFPAMRGLVVDATSEQYEGFSYFGAGVLFLGLMALPDLRRAAPGVWRSHACMIALLVVFTLFALSNRIYLGPWHILTIPLPASIFEVASMFRSSGRFFWPSMYFLTALAIVAAAALRGRTGAWLLLLATVIQIIDTAPLRSALAERISTPVANPLSETAWAEAIRQHDAVTVIPPYGCGAGRNAEEIAMEVQLLASRENVATNTVYASRSRVNCTPPAPLSPTSKELRVFVLSNLRAMMPADPVAPCAASGTLGVCSYQLDSGQLSSLVGAQPAAGLFPTDDRGPSEPQ